MLPSMYSPGYLGPVRHSICSDPFVGPFTAETALGPVGAVSSRLGATLCYHLGGGVASEAALQAWAVLMAG